MIFRVNAGFCVPILSMVSTFSCLIYLEKGLSQLIVKQTVGSGFLYIRLFSCDYLWNRLYTYIDCEVDCTSIGRKMLVSICRSITGYHYPRVFRRKKGDYVLPFAVRPSVPPSVRPAGSSLPVLISSYTIDARITKPICINTFERKLLLTSVTHQLLSYYWC